MRAAGIAGVSQRRGPRTTRRDTQVRPAPDLVERRFEADAPNRLWVSDITYVPTLANATSSLSSSVTMRVARREGPAEGTARSALRCRGRCSSGRGSRPGKKASSNCKNTRQASEQRLPECYQRRRSGELRASTRPHRNVGPRWGCHRQTDAPSWRDSASTAIPAAGSFRPTRLRAWSRAERTAPSAVPAPTLPAPQRLRVVVGRADKHDRLARHVDHLVTADLAGDAVSMRSRAVVAGSAVVPTLWSETPLGKCGSPARSSTW